MTTNANAQCERTLKPMIHQLTQIYVDFLPQVENEKAQFEQEEAVTRVKSDYLVKNILNQG